MQPVMSPDWLRGDLDETWPGHASLPGQKRAAAADGPPVELSTVEGALQEILDRGAALAGPLGGGYAALWDGLAAATRGGKRFRPTLLVAAYRAWGGTDLHSACVIGAAVELLHTSFVIHDDVIDREDRRRGRLNVSGSHALNARELGAAERRAQEYGAAAGLLAGDLALAAALRAVATCSAPAATVQRLLDLFDVALHVTAAGELADVRLSLGVDHATLAESLVTAERKTAVYSFALPLQAAAVLAGAPESVVGPAGQVGRLLGRAFQLADDLQGVFGDPGETGKSSLGDLRSGKQTALVAHARSTAAWPDIAPYVGNRTLSEKQAARARALLEESGSRDFVERLASGCVQDALALSTACELPPMLVAWLQLTTDDLLWVAA